MEGVSFVAWFGLVGGWGGFCAKKRERGKRGEQKKGRKGKKRGGGVYWGGELKDGRFVGLVCLYEGCVDP